MTDGGYDDCSCRAGRQVDRFGSADKLFQGLEIPLESRTTGGKYELDVSVSNVPERAACFSSFRPWPRAHFSCSRIDVLCLG